MGARRRRRRRADAGQGRDVMPASIPSTTPGALRSSPGVAASTASVSRPPACWRDSGRGLPAGRAVAIDDLDPDVVVFAARNRLYLSRDGGLFWTALPVELPEIETLALREA